MSSLPEEMYREILLRVPVTTTYVCKCVCRYWLSILSNPDFVKMHLDISTQRQSCSIIFETYDKRRQRWSVKSVSNKTKVVETLDVYPFDSYSTLRFLGSCNGLVCIWCGTDAEKHVYLYNPATKEYKRITSESKYSYSLISAFGYDCKADDYKLIIIDKDDGDSPLVLDVYTLGENAWKNSQLVPYKFPDTSRQTGILVNGAFHWLGQALENDSSKLIVVFGFNDEKFDELQLSKELLKKKHLSMTIGVLEGCLSVLVTDFMVSFEVWEMRDYGIEESWTQCYAFDRERIARDYAVKLMFSFRNGRIILKTGYKLFTYDLKHSSSCRKSKSSSKVGVIDGVDYVESLVSLDSSTYAR